MSATNANANAMRNKLTKNVYRVMTPMNALRFGPQIGRNILALRNRNSRRIANAKSRAMNASLIQVLKARNMSVNSSAINLSNLRKTFKGQGVTGTRPNVRNGNGKPMSVQVANGEWRLIRPHIVTELDRLIQTRRNVESSESSARRVNASVPTAALTDFLEKAVANGIISQNKSANIRTMMNAPNAARIANGITLVNRGRLQKLVKNHANVPIKVKTAIEAMNTTNRNNQTYFNYSANKYDWVRNAAVSTGQNGNDPILRILANARVMSLTKNNLGTLDPAMRTLVEKAVNRRNGEVRNIVDRFNPKTLNWSQLNTPEEIQKYAQQLATKFPYEHVWREALKSKPNILGNEFRNSTWTEISTLLRNQPNSNNVKLGQLYQLALKNRRRLENANLEKNKAQMYRMFRNLNNQTIQQLVTVQRDPPFNNKTLQLLKTFKQYRPPARSNLKPPVTRSTNGNAIARNIKEIALPTFNSNNARNTFITNKARALNGKFARVNIKTWESMQNRAVSVNTENQAKTRLRIRILNEAQKLANDRMAQVIIAAIDFAAESGDADSLASTLVKQYPYKGAWTRVLNTVPPVSFAHEVAVSAGAYIMGIRKN